MAVTTMLRNGSTCKGKTVMDELGFGILGENRSYGTPINPQKPSHVPGGSSSGSAVAVAAHLVDFALGTDTTGCIRLPSSFCGILGFRPSHGVVSTIGVLPNSQSLDTVGCLASDPSVLHRVGHVLLQLNFLAPKTTRSIIIADDLFQFSKVPILKTVHVVKKVTEKLSDYKTPKHMNFGHYIASNVPSLKRFCEESTNQQNGISTMKALSSVMLLLQRYEFKTNHEEWIRSVKPKLGSDISNRVWAAINTTQENVKSLYKVRTEMRAALQSLLKVFIHYYCQQICQIMFLIFLASNWFHFSARLFKDDGILVIPTVADPLIKLNTKKGLFTEVYDRMYALLSIASLSGCCQVAVPFGSHDDCPISVSLIASHGADKSLLDTVLDMYSSLQEEVSTLQLPYNTNGSIDAAELLKEK
ncbi:hypothetical protein ABFX02_14G099400 [Erythranthe guttata]